VVLGQDLKSWKVPSCSMIRLPLFLVPAQMRAFYDNMRTFDDNMTMLELDLDMAVAIGLVDHTDRAKMFPAKIQLHDNLHELGRFVGKSDHHSSK